MSETLDFDPAVVEAAVQDLDFNRIDVDLILRRNLGELNPRPLLMDSGFFYQFFPGKWTQSHQLEQPIDEKVLKKAYEIAKLGTIEEILQGKNRYATTDQRAYVWMAGRGKCEYCPVNVHPDYMHVDHIVPFSRGGKTLVENLVSCCKRCNIAKGVEDPVKFMELAYRKDGAYLLYILYNERKKPGSQNPDTMVKIYELLT